VKAWKCHREQTQNISVPRGRITLVIFDDRKMSSSKGVLSVFELGRPDNYICVTIPPQLWYGFSCISSDTALVANCPDIPHDPTEAKTIAPAQSHVPYIWSHSITGKNQ
jgi:dTDP-4-dehydrorhamnose 3,5-epimerase